MNKLLRKDGEMEEAEVLEHIPRLACRYCSSFHTVRYGMTWRKKQRYLCRDCRKTFMDNGAAPGMKSPVVVLASALNRFYQDTASLHEIRRSLFQQYGVQPDHANIRRWIVRYTRQAVIALAGAQPRVGREWVMHETRVATNMSGSKPIWLWDIMDSETRFLLATGISIRHSALDCNALFDLAVRRAGSKPEVVFADPGIPIEGYFEEVRPTTNDVRHVLQPLKSRISILRRLRGRGTAHLIVSGWTVHYNFFCLHEELGGKTPAAAAGLEPPLKNWTDVVAM